MFSTYFGLQLPTLLHSSIKLFLLRGWWMSIIPTRHICVLPKLQFCAGNNPGRENRPIKARKESRPFNWILKTFLPGSQHAHMCDLLFHSTIKFLSGTNEICRKREKKRIDGSCARNWISSSSGIELYFRKKRKKKSFVVLNLQN